MTKELKALKEIGKLKENGCYINTTEEYKLVEAALIRADMYEKVVGVETIQDTNKKLKALKIIEEKSVDVFQLQIAIKLTDLDEYNERHTKCLQLTREEYDLLKRVLL